MTAPLTLASKIERVTVYREGALVERAAELPLGDGTFPQSARIAGLPLCLNDDSVRVRLAVNGADARLVASDLRVVLDVPEMDQTLGPARNEELKSAEREEALLLEELGQISFDLRRLREAPIQPRGRIKDEPPGPSPTEARLAFVDFQRERSDALLAREREIKPQMQELQRRIAHLRDEEERGSSARQPRPHELRKAAIVTLRPTSGTGASAQSLRVLLEYRVPGARWAPAYSIHFDRNFSSGRLKMRALVAQNTGEDWNSVPLTLSTAAAQHWTELPELKSLRIGRSQPPPGRKGFRPAPEGADALFDDYRRSAGDANASSGWMEVSTAAMLMGISETELLRRAPSEHWSLMQHDRVTYISYTNIRFAVNQKNAYAAVAAGGGAPAAGAPRLSANTTMVHRGKLEETRMFKADDAPTPPTLAIAPVAMAAPPPPPPPRPAPATAAAPAMSRVRAAIAPGSLMKESAMGGVAEGAKRRASASHADLSADATDLESLGFAQAPESAPPPDLSSRPLLNFGSLRMPPPGRDPSASLRVLNDHELHEEFVAGLKVKLTLDVEVAVAQAWHATARIGAPPNGCILVNSFEGFDYAYRSPAPVNVPSDGQYHSIPLLDQELPSHARYVTVPRESQDVYRFVELANPLDAPLLSGPAEIHVGGEYLLTSGVSTVAPKGKLALGLGVEQAIKIARNTRFSENTTGLMGGALELKHEIEIEVINNTAVSIQLEVRERIPQPLEGQDEVKVNVTSVDPRWEALKDEDVRPGETGLKGGHRWRIDLGPGAKKSLRAAYVVQTSSKNEIVGGNRREN